MNTETTKLRTTVERVAKMPPVVWIAESSHLQRLAFSPSVQHIQQLALGLHSRVSDMKPIKLAHHYAEILTTMAVPPERKHKISIVGLSSRGRFHLLRRNPEDRYEAGGLDNATGHANDDESHFQTAIREINEETGLNVNEMLKSKSATMHDMGYFGWLMHLRTPEGLEPSLVYGNMFILDAPDIEAHHIRLLPKEHTEVITLNTGEIAGRINDLCVWDRFFFRANIPRLGGLGLRA